MHKEAHLERKIKFQSPRSDSAVSTLAGKTCIKEVNDIQVSNFFLEKYESTKILANTCNYVRNGSILKSRIYVSRGYIIFHCQKVSFSYQKSSLYEFI